MSGILDPFTRFTKEQQVAVTKKLHLDDTMRTAALDSEKRKSRCKKNRKTEPVDEDNQEVVNDCRFLDPRSEDGRFTTFVIAEFEEHLLENPVWKAVLGSRRICILQTGFFCSHGLCSLHPEVSVDVVTRAAAKRAKVIGSSYVNSIVTSNELWAAVFLLPAHFIFLRVFLIGWVERDPASGSAGKYLVVMCIYDSLCDDAYKKAKESLVEKLSAYLGNLPSAPWRDEEHLHVVVCKMQQINQTDSVSCGPLTVSVFLRLLRDVRDAEPDVYNGRFSTFVKASGGSAKTPLSIEQLLKRHNMIPVDEHLPGFTVSLMTNLRLRIFEIILQGRHPSMPPTSVRASVHPNSEVDVTASCSSSSRTAAASASVRIIPDASRTTRAPPTSSWFDPEPNVQCPPVVSICWCKHQCFQILRWQDGFQCDGQCHKNFDRKAGTQTVVCCTIADCDKSFCLSCCRLCSDDSLLPTILHVHPIVFFKESEEICSMTKPCSVCQNASSVCDTCSRSNVRAFYIGCKTCDFVMCLHCSATCRTFYFDSLALSDELSADIQMLKKNWTCNCCGDMHMAANCSLQALEDDEAVVFLNRMPPNCKVKKRRSESDEAQVVLCYRCALRFKLIKRTQHSRTHARTLAEESVRMFPTSS